MFIGISAGTLFKLAVGRLVGILVGITIGSSLGASVGAFEGLEVGAMAPLQAPQVIMHRHQQEFHLVKNFDMAQPSIYKKISL